MGPYLTCREHLQDELARLRLLVAARERGTNQPTQIQQELLALGQRIENRLAQSESAQFPLPIVRLKKTLGLGRCELKLVSMLLLRETELAAQGLFAQVLGNGQGQIAHYIALLGYDEDERAALLSALRPAGLLRRHGILRTGSEPAWIPSTPLLFQRIRLPDRVAELLQGEKQPLPQALPPGVALYTGQRSLAQLTLPPGLLDRLRESLSDCLPPVLSTQAGSLLPPLCLSGSRRSGRKALLWALNPETPLVVVSAANLRGPAFSEPLLSAIAEAILQDALLYVSSAETLGELPPLDFDEVRQRLLGCRARVVLSADGPVDALFARWPELVLFDFPVPDRNTQATMWNCLLPVDVKRDRSFDVRVLANHYSLPAGSIARCAAELGRMARSDGEATQPLSMAVAREIVRKQLGNRFGDLAQPVAMSLSWEDLVLPSDILDRVLEVVAYARYRDKLLGGWGFEQKLPYGRAVSVLFAGPPGTGKTMAAALIAKEIGLELFRVNVARVVERFAGETEKNLARIFDEAQRQQVALLFDEADTLFGRRLEVRSAQDRYANIAVSFLLQAVEFHDGMLFLTTNNEKLLDEAFKRRLRFRINLPLPGETERARLWQSMFPKETPLQADVDFTKLAQEFDLSGGAIKNAVVRAALRAMVQGTSVTHPLLRQCAKLECEEMGILVSSDAEVWDKDGDDQPTEPTTTEQEEAQ